VIERGNGSVICYGLQDFWGTQNYGKRRGYGSSIEPVSIETLK